MATTEVYWCLKGESLRDAPLEVRPDIVSRDLARFDAEEKCRGNKKLQKVLYYRIEDSGQRRLLFSFENPYMSLMVGEPPDEGAEAKRKARKRRDAAKNAPKSGLAGKFGRLIDNLFYE